MPELRQSLWSRAPRSGRAEAARFALAAGPAGIYVANALLANEDGTEDLFVHHDGSGGIVALAWVGARGNLVGLSERPDRSGLLGAQIAAMPLAWRIAIADAAFVDALLARESRPPLLCRGQVFYRANPMAAPKEDVAEESSRPMPGCRLAVLADTEALCAAGLGLNESDLAIPPDRVHRGWLRRTVRRRIRQARTWVIGPVGEPVCKVDVGSRGPAGAVIEGVFTHAACRGRGLATALVRHVIGRLASEVSPIVLHVGEHNAPARAAYARAGMEPVDHVAILLRDR